MEIIDTTYAMGIYDWLRFRSPCWVHIFSIQLVEYYPSYPKDTKMIQDP